MAAGPRAVSIAAAAALHAAAFAAALQLDAVRKPLLDAMPIMVSLIAPPRPEAPPKIAPPKPRPAARAPATQPRPAAPPLVSVEVSAPSPVTTAPPPAEPAPVAAPPAPVMPPSFHAAYLRNPSPAYPPLSRRRGEQGTVVLRVFVDAQGGAEQVQVLSPSGYELLDQAAQEAVRRWRFVPARQADRAVAAWVLVPIRFALEN